MEALLQITRPEKVKRIRELNDRLRQTFIGGRILLTSAVATLEPEAKVLVLTAIQNYSSFDEANDPHGEHDMCPVEVRGQLYFAKIDYYAPDLQHGSEDPSDEKQTTRVLTIMRADEY